MFPSTAPFESEQWKRTAQSSSGMWKIEIQKNLMMSLACELPVIFTTSASWTWMHSYRTKCILIIYTRWRRQENGCGLSFDSRVRASSHARALASAAQRKHGGCIWVRLVSRCCISSAKHIRNLCKMKRSSKYFNCIKGRKNMQMELNAKLFRNISVSCGSIDFVDIAVFVVRCDQISETIINWADRKIQLDQFVCIWLRMVNSMGWYGQR